MPKVEDSMFEFIPAPHTPPIEQPVRQEKNAQSVNLSQNIWSHEIETSQRTPPPRSSQETNILELNTKSIYRSGDDEKLPPREEYCELDRDMHCETRRDGLRCYRGPRPDMNFTIIHNSNSKPRISESDSKVHYWIANPEVNKERQNLFSLVSSQIADQTLRDKFTADMARFEERCAKRGLPLQQISDSYHEIARMFDPKLNGRLPYQHRLNVAEEVMRQCATPTSIDQGCKPTCNVTTVEVVLYSKYPAIVTKALADAVLRGASQFASGIVVPINPKELLPDAEGKSAPTRDGLRSNATKIMNQLLVNLAWLGSDDRYRYSEVGGNAKLMAGKEQARVNGEPSDHPTLTPGQVAMAYRLATLEHKSPIFVDHADRQGALDVFDITEKRSRLWDKNGGVIYIQDQNQLHILLQQAKVLRQLPIIVSVETGFPAFHGPEIEGSDLESNTGRHVVTIQDYDADKKLVTLDNQWGHFRDHLSDNRMPLRDLYVSMRGNPQGVDELRKDALKSARQDERIIRMLDGVRCSLRLQISAESHMSPLNLMEGIFKEMKNAHLSSEAEKVVAVRIVEVIAQLNLKERFTLLRKMNDSGALTQEDLLYNFGRITEIFAHHRLQERVKAGSKQTDEALTELSRFMTELPSERKNEFRRQLAKSWQTAQTKLKDEKKSL